MINKCKCGSNKQPILDSDDFVPCWSVRCSECKQNIHHESWSKEGAVTEWNKKNKVA